LKITYVSFLSTKVSEIFDMTNSWVTFVAQVILNIIFLTIPQILGKYQIN